MRKSRLARYLALAVSALAVFACATTTFQSTWKSPEARPLRVADRKVLGLFLNRDSAVRRRAEDAMAREISARGARGVPAYTVLSEEETRDRDAAKAKLEQRGFITELATAVSKRLEKEGLLAPSERTAGSGAS